MIENYNDIDGAGGGKGGGSGGHEASDTLVTDQVIKVLHLLSEGVCNLATGDGRSIYLNNTPLQNADMSYNFNNCNWDFRSGTATQTPMTNPAFPSSSAILNVNQEFTGGTITPSVPDSPVIYNVTSALTDYCKVAIQFPNGLANVDGGGNIVGDTVTIAIDTKPHSSSTWLNVINHTFNDKSNAAAVVQFQVNRDPSATGALWDIRCRRLTVDNSSATRHNNTVLSTVEEIQQIVLPYNGVAYCGIALDARNIGGMNTAIPIMSFLMQGVTVNIPSNYNTTTSTYSGLWDGTFTTGITDNPAWILYDMLTNANYGCGLLGITPAMIDKYSFYNAGFFNDGLVPSGVSGGTERRFTFNAPIQNRKDMLVTLMEVAGMMNGVLGIENGLITLLQDRPTSSMYVINKSNVIQDSKTMACFTYASSALPTRTTAVNVTFTNAADLRYLPKTTSLSDAAGLTRYGYQSYDLAAFGATTEGQAIRAGRWWLFSNLYMPEQVTFKMGLEGLTSNLYDVFDLYDDDYTGRAGSGRVISATTNTVTLDQPVVIDGTSPKISVLLADGVTYETHPVTNGPGTFTTLTISSTWSALPTQYCPYVVTSAVAPRTFKIVDLKIDAVTKEVDVTAQVYNSGNYSYIESGIALPAVTYRTPDLLTVSDPTGITFTPTQFINPVDGTLQRGLQLQWVAPTTTVSGYVVQWRKDNGNYQTSTRMSSTSFELTNLLDGLYTFTVFATNLANQTSPGAQASYTYNSAGGGSSTTLSEITGLSVTGGGTNFAGQDCPFTWTNPIANQGLLKDFVVTVTNPNTSTLLRTIVVPAVTGGLSQSYVYTYAMNLADNGAVNGPTRNLLIKVQGRDAWNNTTAGITATLTANAPAVPSGITVTGLQGSIAITWTAPANPAAISGYLIWASQTSGFTPSSGNLVYQGSGTAYIHPNLTTGATWYYKVAAYDVFGASQAGTGLNVSSQYTASATSSVGILGVTSLPGSGTEGQVVFNTTDGQLYRYHSGAWTVAVPAVNVGAGLLGTQIAAGTILGNNIAGNTITAGNLVANTITAGQIASNSITSSQIAANTILGSNIAANTIVGNNISGGTITGSLIAANTITAGNLSVGSLSAITATLGSVTAGAISGSSIYGGSYGNAYAWPGSGGGFYLGPSGLLLGNASTGPGYFQLTAAGDMYAPGISIVSGALTISQANVINTLQLAGNAVTVPAGAVTSGGSAGVTGNYASASISLSQTGAVHAFGSVNIVSGSGGTDAPASCYMVFQQYDVTGTTLVGTTYGPTVYLTLSGGHDGSMTPSIQVMSNPPGIYVVTIFVNVLQSWMSVNSSNIFVMGTKR